MQLRFVAYCACLTLLAPSSVHGRDALSLPTAVARVMERRNVPLDSLSIYVLDVASDEVLLDYHSDVPRSPASTIKVLTTFAALDALGPAFTWKTRAFVQGSLRDGTLDGDLILVGGGDPYMTSERWWSFARGLRRTGLVRVRGDVVIDNTYFAATAVSRATFDGQPYRSYNVVPDALLVNFQTSEFVILADPQRGRASVTVDPLPWNLVIDNELRLGRGRCQGYNRGVSFSSPEGIDGRAIRLTGAFPASCGRFSINRAIMNAPEYAYGTFRSLWEQLGGEIDGGLRVEAKPEQASLAYTHESLTLAEIIRLVNKFSSNVMARHLLLTLGAEKFGAPATVAKGDAAVAAWLHERGLEVGGLHLENGSGLSREERITARGMAEVLRAAWHSPYMPEFSASLPLSATDGTLRKRFGSAGMQGRLRMKTGRIDDVSGLAGFVTSASGSTFVTVVMLNHRGVQYGIGDEVQYALLRWVFAQ